MCAVRWTLLRQARIKVSVDTLLKQFLAAHLGPNT